MSTTTLTRPVASPARMAQRAFLWHGKVCPKGADPRRCERCAELDGAVDRAFYQTAPSRQSAAPARGLPG